MAKAPSGIVFPFNGSSEYTIFLGKETLSHTSMSFDVDGNMSIEVHSPLGRRVEDLRVPPGSTTIHPKQATLTLKLK